MTVYKYNPTKDSGSSIDNNMQTTRYHPLVAVIQNKMIIVGGKQIAPSSLIYPINNVEIANVY